MPEEADGLSDSQHEAASQGYCLLQLGLCPLLGISTAQSLWEPGCILPAVLLGVAELWRRAPRSLCLTLALASGQEQQELPLKTGREGMA